MPTIPQSGLFGTVDEEGNLVVYAANAASVTVKWANGVDAGFVRGVTDTDRTALFCRSPNGTKKYLLIADDNTVTASATAP